MLQRSSESCAFLLNLTTCVPPVLNENRLPPVARHDIVLPWVDRYGDKFETAVFDLADARCVVDCLAAPHETADPPPGRLAEYLAGFVCAANTMGRTRMLARYEFALEATRRPELREAYDRGAMVIRRRCREVLAAAGSPDPARHAELLVAWLDGTIFDALAGTGSRKPPTHAALIRNARDVLTALGI